MKDFFRQKKQKYQVLIMQRQQQAQKQQIETQHLTEGMQQSQQLTQHKIGHLTIKASVTTKQLAQLIQQQKLQEIQHPIERQTDIKSVIECYFNTFKNTKFKKKFELQILSQPFLPNVIQSTQQVFYLGKFKYNHQQENQSQQSKNSRILNLWRIQFPHLKILDLTTSFLLNIEGLSFCNLPNLTTLKLEKNMINSIDILQKCLFQNIQSLSFYDNHITNLKSLSRFKCPNLVQFQKDKRITKMEFLFGSYILYNQPIQSIQMIIKMEFIPNIKHKFDIDLSFSNRIQPKWYAKIMPKINSQIKLYNGDHSFWIQPQP